MCGPDKFGLAGLINVEHFGRMLILLLPLLSLPPIVVFLPLPSPPMVVRPRCIPKLVTMHVVDHISITFLILLLSLLLFVLTLLITGNLASSCGIDDGLYHALEDMPPLWMLVVGCSLRFILLFYYFLLTLFVRVFGFMANVIPLNQARITCSMRACH